MNCKEFSEYMGDYVNHTLSDEIARGVEAHLHACPDCSSLAKELESTSPLVRSLEYQKAPAGFEARLKARLRAAPRALAQAFQPQRSD